MAAMIECDGCKHISHAEEPRWRKVIVSVYIGDPEKTGSKEECEVEHDACSTKCAARLLRQAAEEYAVAVAKEH